MTVTGSGGCDWIATSQAPWITIVAEASGTGDGVVRYSVAANPSATPRTGTLTIAGQTFSVAQAGATCSFTLSSTGQAFDAGGGTGSVGVTTPTGCSWTASSNAAWITITAETSGDGPGTVSYSVAANPSATPRRGTLTIAGQTYTVSQAGASCSYTLSATSQTVGASGGNWSVEVSAPAGCDWTANSNADWISVTEGASGNGNAAVTYSVTANIVPNASTPLRTGTLTIGGLAYTVTQEGLQCVYDLASSGQSYPATGGDDSVTVATSQGECRWTASSNASWITITRGSSGSGNETVTYTVAANSSTSVRTGILTIAGLTLTVTEAGVICSYTLSSTRQAFDASGGSGSVKVAAATGCTWSAASNAAWMTITSGAVGNGSGTVSYAVAGNPTTSSRTATLTIAGLTYTVIQAGVSCSFSLSATGGAFGASGGAGSVAVTAPTVCAWTATSNAAWITITSGASGTGNGTVGCTVAANPSASPRTGNLTIAGLTYTVAQQGGAVSLLLAPKPLIVDAGTSLPTTLTVRDANGSPITNPIVVYATRKTSVASVSTSGAVTGVARGQAVIVATAVGGTTPSDSLLAIVAVPGGPVLMTDIAQFTYRIDTVVTVTVMMDMRASGERLGSTTVGLTWNPALLIYQSYSSGGSGVPPTVNASNAANGSLTLAMADPNGFSGRIELLKITFRAGSVPGVVGSLGLTAAEVTGAVTFTDLTSKAVAVAYPLVTR